MFTKLSREAIVAARSGSGDAAEDDRAWAVTTAPADFEAVYEALSRMGWTLELSDVPANPQVIADADPARKIFKHMDKLEELDDVQRVASTFELPDALMAELSSLV